MMSNILNNFLLIDLQNDFCHPNGSLFIPNSIVDNVNLEFFLKKNLLKINELFITLDTHWVYNISHPTFWLTANNRHPDPFTIVTLKSLHGGLIRPINLSQVERVERYLMFLSEKNIQHTIWPEHCLVGGWGQQLESSILSMLEKFQQVHHKAPVVVHKGLNPYSEHFSALSAVLSDSKDLAMHSPQKLVQQLLNCDFLYVAGQSLSHCVAQTIIDLFNYISDKNLMKKIILLTDCTSCVPGFEDLSLSYLNLFSKWGVQLLSTREVSGLS